MIDYYISNYGRNGIILDTNLLLLMLVGAYSPDYISDYKRTQKYTREDYEWICLILKYFAKVVITPQILAEVWNFAEKIPDYHLVEFIKSSVKALEIIEEIYIEKQVILSNTDELQYVGVSDLSIIHAAKRGNYVIFTDDLRSYHCFMTNEVPSINLNHIRTSNWL